MAVADAAIITELHRAEDGGGGGGGGGREGDTYFLLLEAGDHLERLMREKSVVSGHQVEPSNAADVTTNSPPVGLRPTNLLQTHCDLVLVG